MFILLSRSIDKLEGNLCFAYTAESHDCDLRCSIFLKHFFFHLGKFGLAASEVGISLKRHDTARFVSYFLGIRSSHREGKNVIPESFW